MGNMQPMPEQLETRTVLSPRTGTRICVLIALVFAVAAVYFYFVPVTGVRTTTGSVFGCGTAAKPSTGSFAEGVCWRATDVYKYRAFACGAVAVLILVVGGLFFGVDRRQETRQAARQEDRRDDRPRWAGSTDEGQSAHRRLADDRDDDADHSDTGDRSPGDIDPETRTGSTARHFEADADRERWTRRRDR